MRSMTKLDDNIAPQNDDEVGGEDWDNAFDEFYEEELKDEASSDNGDGDSDEGSDEAAQDDDSNSDEGNSNDDDASDEEEKNNSDKEDVVENNDDKSDEEDKSKNAVKEALKEVYSEQQQAEAELNQTIEEALAVVRPEGIPDPRVDSDGDPIKSPADVEKLYNPATGELFTPSEAKAWYDQATQTYEQNVQEAQREARHVAHVAQKINKDREAVMRAYGDFINENPDIAKKVLMSYMATMKIKGEGDNAYIADAPIDMLGFYNDVMYPYVELAEKNKEAAEAKAAAEKAKEDALKRGKAERDESRDFRTNVGDDATKTGEESDWDDAFKQYYGGK